MIILRIGPKPLKCIVCGKSSRSYGNPKKIKHFCLACYKAVSK